MSAKVPQQYIRYSSKVHDGKKTQGYDLVDSAFSMQPYLTRGKYQIPERGDQIEPARSEAGNWRAYIHRDAPQTG